MNTVPEIRVHPEEDFIAVRDRPGSARPWAKVVPGVSLSEDDVADWRPMEPGALVTRIREALAGVVAGPGALRAALAEALDLDAESVRVGDHMPSERTEHGRDVALRIEILR